MLFAKRISHVMGIFCSNCVFDRNPVTSETESTEDANGLLPLLHVLFHKRYICFSKRVEHGWVTSVFALQALIKNAFLGSKDVSDA